METIKTNKEIAKFLGLTHKATKGGFMIKGIVFKYEKLNFHNDWNSLMEVVEKIESLGYSTELKFIAGLGNTMFFISGGAEVPLNRRIFKTKIEAVYNACVTFIEWYNEQPK